MTPPPKCEYELFADDARHWMPFTRGQPNGETYTSPFYEDELLLKVRIERLRIRLKKLELVNCDAAPHLPSDGGQAP